MTVQITCFNSTHAFPTPCGCADDISISIFSVWDSFSSYSRALAKKDAALAAVMRDHEEKMELAKEHHEHAMVELEERLTSHFASVLTKVTANADQNDDRDKLIFEYKPMVFPSSAKGGALMASAAGEGVHATDDVELIATSESLVSVANSLLERAARWGMRLTHRASFSTHRSLGGDSTVASVDQHGKGLGDEMEAELACTALFSEAEVAFTAALTLNPACTEASVGLANLNFKSRRDACALLAKLRSAIDVNPECAGAWHALGEVLGEKLERWGDATDHFQRACALEPKNEKYLASFEEARKKGPNARLSAGTAAEVYGTTVSDEHLARTSKVLVEKGYRLLRSDANYFDAKRAFESSLMLSSGDAAAQVGLARVCLASGDHLRALDAAHAGLATARPHSEVAAEAMSLLAKIYEGLSDGASAEMWYQQAAQTLQGSRGMGDDEDMDDQSIRSSRSQQSGRSQASGRSQVSGYSQKSNRSHLSQNTGKSSVQSQSRGVSLGRQSVVSEITTDDYITGAQPNLPLSGSTAPLASHALAGAYSAATQLQAELRATDDDGDGGDDDDDSQASSKSPTKGSNRT
jgi:tetratricopeptide (TPR) repeat protein